LSTRLGNCCIMTTRRAPLAQITTAPTSTPSGAANHNSGSTSATWPSRSAAESPALGSTRVAPTAPSGIRTSWEARRILGSRRSGAMFLGQGCTRSQPPFRRRPHRTPPIHSFLRSAIPHLSSFSRVKKFKTDASRTPGPGTYEQSGTIGNIPQYAMIGRTRKINY